MTQSGQTQRYGSANLTSHLLLKLLPWNPVGTVSDTVAGGTDDGNRAFYGPRRCDLRGHRKRRRARTLGFGAYNDGSDALRNRASIATLSTN